MTVVKKSRNSSDYGATMKSSTIELIWPLEETSKKIPTETKIYHSGFLDGYHGFGIKNSGSRRRVVLPSEVYVNISTLKSA